MCDTGFIATVMEYMLVNYCNLAKKWKWLLDCNKSIAHALEFAEFLL